MTISFKDKVARSEGEAGATIKKSEQVR